MTTVGTALSSLANGTIFSQVTIEARGALLAAAIPAEGVTVFVYVHIPGYLPTSSSTQASVYSDEFLTVPLPQPLTTDTDGRIPGYMAPGQILDVVASGGPLPSEQVLSINTQASASTLAGDVSGAALSNAVYTVLGGKTPVIATSFAGAPTTGLWTAGQSTIDSAGAAWSCTVTGTPGTWVGGLAATALTALTTETTNRTNADALLIPLTQKGAASGVASLDGTTKIPVAQIPPIDGGTP